MRSIMVNPRNTGQTAGARHPRRSIIGYRGKIVAWAFIPAALILAAVVLIAFVAYQRITADMVMERDRQLIQVAALQLAGELEERAAPLEQVARLLAVTDEIGDLRQRTLVGAAETLADFDGGVVVVDAAGRVVAAQPSRPALLGQDWSAQPFWRELGAARDLVYSDVLVGGSEPAGGQLHAAAMAVPVVGAQGDWRGGVVGFYRLDTPDVGPFSDTVLSLPLQPGRRIYLVDSHGRVLYHADPQAVGDDYAALPAVQSVLSGSNGARRAVDGQGEAVVTAYARVPGTPWSMVAEEPWATLIAPYAGYRNFLLLLLGLGLIVPAAVVGLGVRRLMRPLDALTAATQRVARGHFGQTVTVTSGDEIEILAHHFNVMSGELAALYARQEQRLAARTRELAALTAIAAAISHADELDAVLDVALGEALGVMEMAAGGVYLLDEQEQILRLVAHRGVDEAFARDVDNLAVGEGFSGDVVARGEPVLVDDLTRDPRLSRPAARVGGFHAMVSFPLRASGQVLGALFMLSSAVRTFSSEDVELLTSIGQQIGVAVENARLLERVQAAAAQDERQRLARELHDAVTQTLFSASLIADVLPRVWEKDPELAAVRLAELSELNRGALAEMRTLLLELRPAVLVESALPDLLRQLVEAVRGRARLQIGLEVEGAPPKEGLPPDVLVALYRIAQESLNNVVKHAEATRVSVQLAFGVTGVLLSVVDDGRGFDAAADHNDSLGLNIMQERAARIGAELQIESAPGAGTAVTVIVSL